jgi:hypothetical protein
VVHFCPPIYILNVENLITIDSALLALEFSSDTLVRNRLLETRFQLDVLSDCKKIAPQHQLVQLIRQFDILNGVSVADYIANPSGEEPLELFHERMQIQLALATSGEEKKEKDHVVTCHLCGKYTIMYQPGMDNPEFRRFENVRNYWFQQMEEAMIKKREKDLVKLEADKQRIAKERASYQRTIDLNMDRKITELAKARIQAESSESNSEQSLGLSIKERMKTWGTKEKEEKIKAQIRESGEVRPEVVCGHVVRKLEQFDQKHPGDFFNDEEKRIHNDFISTVQGNLKASKKCSTSAELNAVFPVFQGLDPSSGSAAGPSETTKFAVCETKSCEGAFCLICEIPLRKTDLGNHECAANAVSALYSEVLRVLASASTRTCPHCSSIGMKDLACTHITCTKCAKRWCYVCLKPDSKWPERHNEWTLDTTDPERCPQYLEYKYGDTLGDGNRMMRGEPGKALAKFHADLQRIAIEDFKKSQDPALWDKMLAAYFPKGIFD